VFKAGLRFSAGTHLTNPSTILRFVDEKLCTVRIRYAAVWTILDGFGLFVFMFVNNVDAQKFDSSDPCDVAFSMCPVSS
jgi:hypothetical protein